MPSGRELHPLEERIGYGTFTIQLTSETLNFKAMQNHETVKNEPAVHANVGEHIGYELGAKMIKDFYDTHKEGGAHFMGKNIIEDIINQPGCIGIKIFRGLNENGNLAYVFVGVNEDNTLITTNAVVTPLGQIQKEEGIVADRARLIGWYDYNSF